MLSLYELETQYKTLIDEYSDTPDDLEAWNVLLDELTGSIDVKVTNIALVVKQLDAEKTALADEIKRLQAKKKTRENKVGRLKDYMLEGMKMAGIDKTTDVRASVRIQRNPPKLKILLPDMIPDEYWKVRREVDTTALKDALKEGAEIDGAELVQEEGVRIK